jgi:hypothetical protein
MRLAIIGSLIAAMVAVPAVSVADTGDSDGGCEMTMVPARESHGARLLTQCAFEQLKIRINANTVIYDVSALVKGQADEEDGLSCTNRDRPRALCRGEAGEGAKVSTYIETKSFTCDNEYRIHVTGSTDCDPQPSCDQVGFRASRRFEHLC